MKSLSVTILGTALLSVVSAYPKLNADQLKTYRERTIREAAPESCPFAGKREGAADGCPFSEPKSRPRRSDKKRDTFNAAEQLISVSGSHAFQPPNFDAGDQRGPCPGLNALANHNYLPHNGVADIPTIISAVNSVYSMSLDLGTFLAVYGTLFDGSPVSLDPGYSIGGPSSARLNILGGGGLLGTPSGLSGSHNKYESDVSPTRGDLYVTGNNYHVVQERFIQYYNYLPENTPSTQQYQALAPFHAQRFDESVNTNPYFFYSPFAGILVSPAGYNFPVRMMANHSAEYPDGYLDRATFASFFGVDITGDPSDPSSFNVKQGWEQIPANWYRRPSSDQYSIPDFLVDVVDHAAYDPRLLSFGGNTGTTNSFTFVDIGNLTGGVYNAQTLLDGNNLECFAFQSVLAAAPDILGSEYTNNPGIMKPLADTISQSISSLACPQIENYNQALFEKYPGYSRSYSGYNGQ